MTPRSLPIALALALMVTLAGWAEAGEFTVSGRSEYRILKSRLQAIQFLARATFAYSVPNELSNPNSPDNDVDELAREIRRRGHRRALSNWINNQAGMTASLHEPTIFPMMQVDNYTDLYNRPSGAPFQLDYRDYAWWRTSLQAPDQLRQRTAHALMQIVVINRDPTIFRSIAADSSVDVNGVNQARYLGIVDYYDTLLERAFDNYRNVLQDVTYHPVMGVFLTHRDNQKPSADGLLLPDENYAREILQLFSMGEHRLNIYGEQVRDRGGNLIQNYTNEDIKALARVFTGLRYAAGDGSTGINLHDPMEVRTVSWHDFDEKVFPNLRLTLPARTPSANEANEEISAAIDHIYAHPNVGPHLARILIQRFVKANPSKRYIRDVANVFNNNGQNVRGDLLAVVRAILLHREALNSQRYQRIRGAGRQIVGLRVRMKGSEHSKLVEPILRYTQFIGMFEPQPVNAAQGIRLRPHILDLAQLPYQAPSVFNYYRPEYQPPGYEEVTPSRNIPDGRLVSPEAQIYTPVFANRFQNLVYRHTHNNVSSYNSLDFSTSYATEESLAASGMANDDFLPLLERLDLIMCHGSLSTASKTAINNALIDGHLAGNNNASELARLAIFGVFGTPECAIDE